MTEKSENKDLIQRVATMDKPVANPDEEGVADKDALKKQDTGVVAEGQEKTDDKELERMVTPSMQDQNGGAKRMKTGADSEKVIKQDDKDDDEKKENNDDEEEEKNVPDDDEDFDEKRVKQAAADDSFDEDFDEEEDDEPHGDDQDFNLDDYLKWR